MREAAFTEFHQVCRVVSQAFGSASCRLFRFFGGMLFENAKGAGTCSFKVDIIVRQEANDYLSVEAYNSA